MPGTCPLPSNDLIDDSNGIVCDGFTEDDLVKGIRKAMSSRYDAKSIRESLLSRYSYDQIGKQYIDCYQQCLHEKGVAENS